jgi:hypothetical protein
MEVTQMIPDLALVAAAYVSFRMIEVFLSPAARYSSQGGRVAACIFATLVLIGTGLCALDIVLSASGIPISR